VNVVGFHTVVYVFKFTKDYELRDVFMPFLAVVDPNLPLCLNIFVSGHNFMRSF
jgi:hypothetical protein